jgi:hypothetical protein
MLDKEMEDFLGNPKKLDFLSLLSKSIALKPQCWPSLAFSFAFFGV